MEQEKVKHAEWRSLILNLTCTDLTDFKEPAKFKAACFVLSNYGDYETGAEVHPSWTTVGKKACISRTLAYKVRDWLIAGGWIIKTGTTPGNVDIYQLSSGAVVHLEQTTESKPVVQSEQTTETESSCPIEPEQLSITQEQLSVWPGQLSTRNGHNSNTNSSSNSKDSNSEADASPTFSKVVDEEGNPFNASGYVVAPLDKSRGAKTLDEISLPSFDNDFLDYFEEFRLAKNVCLDVDEFWDAVKDRAQRVRERHDVSINSAVNAAYGMERRERGHD